METSLLPAVSVSPIMRRLVEEMVDEYLAGDANQGFGLQAAQSVGTSVAVVEHALCELVRQYRGAYLGLKSEVLGAAVHAEELMRRQPAA